jgi:hypothetical protein
LIATFRVFYCFKHHAKHDFHRFYSRAENLPNISDNVAKIMCGQSVATQHLLAQKVDAVLETLVQQ